MNRTTNRGLLLYAWWTHVFFRRFTFDPCNVTHSIDGVGFLCLCVVQLNQLTIYHEVDFYIYHCCCLFSTINVKDETWNHPKHKLNKMKGRKRRHHLLQVIYVVFFSYCLSSSVWECAFGPFTFQQFTLFRWFFDARLKTKLRLGEKKTLCSHYFKFNKQVSMMQQTAIMCKMLIFFFTHVDCLPQL